MKPTKLFNLLAIVIAFCTASCGDMKKADNTASTDKNKESMKKVFEMFETGNSQEVGNYVADNMVDHNITPEIKSTGVQALKDMIAMQHTAFPNTKITVYSMSADGDKVIAHYNMKGTMTGPMGNMPASNKSMDVDGVDIVRFADGKAVEHWGYMEEMKMMNQLGANDMSHQNENSTATNDASVKVQEKK